MNRIAIFAAALAVALPAIGNNSMVLNGVKYTIEGDGTATASAVKSKDPKLKTLQIPTLLNVNNLSIFVTRIAKNGFKDCPNLQSVILPNSIKHIGADAFSNCKMLETVVLPDDATVEILPANFGTGGNGPFKGCVKLTTIRGNNSTLPEYVLTLALKDCYDVPFAYNANTGDSKILSAIYSNDTSAVPPFSQFAEWKVRHPMEIWEKRKPYESAEQYMQRVTDASREAKLKELLAQAHEEYLTQYAPPGISGTVEYYDPDYNVFTIDTHSFGEIYAKVPKDEAEAFRKRWNAVRLMPRFGILGDRLAVLSCTFSLDGKSYESESTYTDETESGYKNMLRPLSELLAENTVGDSAAPAQAAPARPAKRVIDQVDLKIPATGVKDNRTFALVIGNEHYQGSIKGVAYAANDAEIFAKYCRRTLGLPEANVKLLTDATLGQLTSAIEEIKNKAKALKGNARIIFYYSGHGKPDDNDRQAYMVPVDASPYSNRTNYSLSELYRELSQADAQLVTVFLDACFSGATRNDDMLVAARAMRQVPREETPLGNMVVFTAASDAETAYPIEAKSHGVFTYALLDKLQTSEGKVSLGELADHITRSVTDISLSANRPQNPKVLVSPSLTDWSAIRLRK
ncbi:MAG: caspase family protein [Muribaculaceae bacterium]|nr:caspase family protein [Muribaculaceae bacterium]